MDVDKSVSEALQQLPPGAEQLLRTRYGIGRGAHTRTTRPPTHWRKIEAVALRRLWMGATAPGARTCGRSR
jgi:hypothetical protein